jgi:FkbM family methyltransferase
MSDKGLGIGRGERFRTGSWFERCVDRLRATHSGPAPQVLKRLHETVLDRWPGDHLVSTLPNGERVRVAARHRGLCWNPEEYRAFRESVGAGAVVFDVGANLGAYTLLFAQWASPNGRVFAFEPAPASLTGLRRHLQLNGVNDRVEVVAAAVSESSGTATFHMDRHGGTSGLFTATDAASTPVTVATTTLDHFCAERGVQPNVIKIDVEGAELEVVRGGRETLASPAVTTFVEFHPAIWTARGFTPGEVERELALFGFAAQPLDPSFDVWTMEGVCARLVRR